MKRGKFRLDEDGFAELLMSEDRKKWQNPRDILLQIGDFKETTIADLACGPGFFTIPLANMIDESSKIYAVDHSSTMLKHLKTNLERSVPADSLKHVSIIDADVTNTTIPDHSIDIAIFANVLHDLDDPKLFFDELKRISSTNCRVVDIDWHKQRVDDMGPPPEIRLSENDSRTLLNQNGYYVVHALNAGQYHYGLVCRRNS
ncbi:MAG: class I SAM-dependent methyltransferase [Thaumarchaeota archaeon]|nr:class I SAM-dependent methyltransferase [Nitrososphaerota archaeon]